MCTHVTALNLLCAMASQDALQSTLADVIVTCTTMGNSRHSSSAAPQACIKAPVKWADINKDSVGSAEFVDSR